MSRTKKSPRPRIPRKRGPAPEERFLSLRLDGKEIGLAAFVRSQGSTWPSGVADWLRRLTGRFESRPVPNDEGAIVLRHPDSGNVFYDDPFVFDVGGAGDPEELSRPPGAWWDVSWIDDGEVIAPRGLEAVEVSKSEFFRSSFLSGIDAMVVGYLPMTYVRRRDLRATVGRFVETHDDLDLMSLTSDPGGGQVVVSATFGSTVRTFSIVDSGEVMWLSTSDGWIVGTSAWGDEWTDELEDVLRAGRHWVTHPLGEPVGRRNPSTRITVEGRRWQFIRSE